VENRKRNGYDGGRKMKIGEMNGNESERRKMLRNAKEGKCR
jgi:hypothetical protein